jgi:O-acetyl-ADP-ribose deacetylase (regulator of RNase III)
MYEFVTGDLFDAPAEALVNAVNCVGVAGRGIALRFRQLFPDNFTAYAKACKQGKLRPGKMLITETGFVENPKYIINFPTKRHWKDKSYIEDIQSGLDALIVSVKAHQIRSIALPALGCGLGGLEWSQVRPLLEQSFDSIPDVHVLIFEPDQLTK